MEVAEGRGGSGDRVYGIDPISASVRQAHPVHVLDSKPYSFSPFDPFVLDYFGVLIVDQYGGMESGEGSALHGQRDNEGSNVPPSLLQLAAALDGFCRLFLQKKCGGTIKCGIKL
ncbi:hypothetical protein DsansV1_C05g0052661 [Dioscorea sansibarensis]